MTRSNSDDRFVAALLLRRGRTFHAEQAVTRASFHESEFTNLKVG